MSTSLHAQLTKHYETQKTRIIITNYRQSSHSSETRQRFISVNALCNYYYYYYFFSSESSELFKIHALQMVPTLSPHALGDGSLPVELLGERASIA
jgi:hypothetical protein